MKSFHVITNPKTVYYLHYRGSVVYCTEQEFGSISCCDSQREERIQRGPVLWKDEKPVYEGRRLQSVGMPIALGSEFTLWCQPAISYYSLMFYPWNKNS